MNTFNVQTLQLPNKIWNPISIQTLQIKLIRAFLLPSDVNVKLKKRKEICREDLNMNNVFLK